MSTHKTVYNKLFSKQELSAEKVELAGVNDIEIIAKELFKYDDKIDSLIKELNSNRVKSSVKVEEFEKLVTKVTSQLKELGINPDEHIALGYIARVNNLKKKLSALQSIR